MEIEVRNNGQIHTYTLLDNGTWLFREHSTRNDCTLKSLICSVDDLVADVESLAKAETDRANRNQRLYPV